jgi:hypothetical protein
LDITTYSLEELLQLFELPARIQQIDSLEMKKAKRKYQLLHPDKSGLPNQYFLFYQKAYQKIEEEYLYHFPTAPKPQVHQANDANPAAQMAYQPYHQQTDKRTQKQVQTVLQTMRPEEFQRHMNEMYEAHMATKQDTRRADWMKQDTPAFEDIPTTIKTQEQLAQYMAQLKQKNQALIKHRSPDDLAAVYVTGGGQTQGKRFYEDDDDEEEDLEQYISSDPFSRLKFEDVRKVHGAETILMEPSPSSLPSQRTYQQHKQDFTRSIQPMEKSQAQALLEKQQRDTQIRAEKARQNSLYKTQSYEEKNQAILNSFLRIGNGGSVYSAYK